jgi:uncharacterized membrane protein
VTRKKAHRSTSSPVNSEATAEPDRLGLERLIFFSDAVFAIAITLLALEIRLPTAEDLNDAQLAAALFRMWPQYLAYVLSFLVIGSFWGAHHRKFQLIARYDRLLLTLNLLLLMVVAFIPFPSSVMSESGTRTATIFYALTIIVGGLLFTILWWHASRHDRLIDSHLTPQQRRREFVAPLSTVAIFLLSIGISFFNINLARLVWILILPASFYLNKR